MIAHADRERLPNRRVCETFEIQLDGLHFTCTVGRFADGRVAEVFLSNSKCGSASDTFARDGAIAASLALQYGADIDTLRKALCRDSRGRPGGPLGAALDVLAERSK